MEYLLCPECGNSAWTITDLGVQCRYCRKVFLFTESEKAKQIVEHIKSIKQE